METKKNATDPTGKPTEPLGQIPTGDAEVGKPTILIRPVDLDHIVTESQDPLMHRDTLFLTNKNEESDASE